MLLRTTASCPVPTSLPICVIVLRSLMMALKAHHQLPKALSTMVATQMATDTQARTGMFTHSQCPPLLTLAAMLPAVPVRQTGQLPPSSLPTAPLQELEAAAVCHLLV